MSTAGLSLPALYPHLGAPARLNFLSSLFTQDLAMDLGTANTLIYQKGRGIILNEPSVVAVDEESGKAIAVGHAAKKIFGKTSQSVRCVRPMKDGVIADFDMTSVMIKTFLSRVQRPLRFQRPRIVVGIPSGITQVEKRAVIDASLASDVREVFLVEEPMAAALGIGLPIDKPVGNMVVDIGGGTTEVAILSLNGTVYSQSIRVAGDEMDEAVQRMIKRSFGVQIGIFEAERIKILLGSVLPTGTTPRKISVCGRDIASGAPQQIEIDEDQVRESLQESVSAIISSIATGLEQSTPEITQDILTRGIFLAGGGALLKGLDERLGRETGIKFFRAQDPLSCVVRGVGRVIEDLRQMKTLCIA